MTDNTKPRGAATTAAPSGDSEAYDERYVDAGDAILRAMLRGTTFRLAIQCDTCGTWITAPSSVRRHRGPVCAKRAQEQEASRD